MGSSGSEFPLVDKDDPRVPVVLDMLRKSQFMGGNFTLDARRILAALDAAFPAQALPAIAGSQRPAADPDQACAHENFEVLVEVNRLSATDGGEINAFGADITVCCADCGEKFRWIGVPAGLSPARPMCSVDETELRAPLRPASSDPDFGLGIPGFAIRQVR